MNVAARAMETHTIQRVAGTIRLLAVVSGCISLPFIHPESRLRMILLIIILYAIRAVRIPPMADVLCSATIVLATWAGAWRWYGRVPHLTEIAHYLVPATVGIAVTALLITTVGLDRAGLSTRATAAIVAGLVAATGTTAETMWEIYEWQAMSSFSGPTIAADYPDVMRDMFSGLTGSTVAGIIFAVLRTRGRAGRAVRRPTCSRGQVTGKDLTAAHRALP